ncbi:hypothetical protein BX616_000949 [Lobosporangium transversale]|uniref:Glutathione S-transferase n=1 Tax=Lobosporangium transversale TaxID=64571 RepID=A0A1Y2GVS6_9FUNG|nr:hypothetical protein BCR41DRAFT_419925 [Lobosporangium transversale]KAF9917450.1 hypothetical protein BX616_000949 [Lobosporangium transversale]ORZ26406.1 hypothetical protein BCR41DRAFT_419925 [Lobosporangium transversale]|eukprot:XP_021884171.1 hypothetical protein BCR41DRAFT_419925 [Lobosporangium transversale]
MILPKEISYEVKKESTKFQVFYFSFHGLGACPRALLCFGGEGIQWENKLTTMEKWPQDKTTTPTGYVPVLIETDLKTNTTIEIPESLAMERYLAAKFGLLGDNAREQTLNDIFYAQAVMLNTKFVDKVFWTFEEVRVKSLNQLLESTLPDWVKLCEKHLMENGNTGHFVDNKFTLADIKTAVVLDTFLGLDSEKVLGPISSPGLWKLKETVDTHPVYAAWRKSEEYKIFDSETQASVGTLMSFNLSKSHIFT